MVSAKKNVPDSQLTFLKMIRKSYLARHYLPIPEPVYSKYSSNLLKGTLTLNGDWQVEIADGAIKEGWDSFCRDNELRESDYLVFHHGGGRNLLADFYNSDGSAKGSKTRGRGKTPVVDMISDEDEGELERQDEAKKKKKGENLVVGADKVVEVVQGIVAQLDLEHADVSFRVTKVPKSPASPAAATATAASPAKLRLRSASTPAAAAPVVVEDDDEAGPSATAAASPERGKALPGRKRAAAQAKSSEPPKKKAKTPGKAAVKTPEKEKSPKAEKTPPKAEKTAKALKAEKKTPKTPKAKAVKIPRAKAEKTPKASSSRKRKSPPAKAVELVEVTPPEKKQTPAKRTPKSKKAEKNPEEESTAVRKARAYASGKPSTVLVMKKSNLQPCFYLGIPSDFSKAHMPAGIQEFEMLDEDSRVWTVRWLGAPKNAFSGGWCYFAQDHHLDLGDACVLEVVSGVRVKILIFRANGLPAIPNPTPAKANPKANGTPAANAANGTPGKANTVVAAAAATPPILDAAVIVTRTEITVSDTPVPDANKDVPVVENVDVDVEEVVAVITQAPAPPPAAAAVEVVAEAQVENDNNNNNNGGDGNAAAPAGGVTPDDGDDDEDDEDYHPENEQS